VSATLSVKGLAVQLGKEEILRGLDLELDAGCYGVILGPSGAGKSTLLRAIAGLVPATGMIRIGSSLVCENAQIVKPERRALGYQFQDLALWPHMTVRAHLDFALAGRKVPRGQRVQRIGETLEPLGLAGLEARRPSALSGGERQRLALARALVTRPDLLLLDEPTSSVDPRTAMEVHDLLAGLNQSFGITVLHVTHDQREALALADVIAIIDAGVIVQSGSPEEIYLRPRGRMAASFVGAGGLLPGLINEHGRADTPLGSVSLVESGSEDAASGPVWVLVRPADVVVVPEGEGIPVDVVRVAYHGGCWRAHATVGEHTIQVDLERPAVTGDRLRVQVVHPLWVAGRREAT